MSAQTHSAASSAKTPAPAWQCHISWDAEHRDWDSFLERTPGGHHTQTSVWALAKARQGWKAARVIVAEGSRILGGAQMLIRSLPLVGAVGYVAKAPVSAPECDGPLDDLVLGELHRLGRANGVRCLVLQPPNEGHALAGRLPSRGFRPIAIQAAPPTATALLDLSHDLETLLARMHSQTRYNARLGLRRGIVTRPGTAADVPTFCRLLAATAARQGFTPEPEAYVAELYRLMAARGWLTLFIAEYQGEPVSAALAVSFGDTVYYKRGAWSGREGRHRPNEAMQWEMIQWARREGYRYYDFEGIDPGVAGAVLRGEAPDPAAHTVSSFKLGFGGEVRLFPGMYAYVYNPLLRRISEALAPAAPHLSRFTGRLLEPFRGERDAA